VVRHTLNLHKIGTRVPEPRLKKAVMYFAVVGQQEQAFAVSVETSCGVHVRRESMCQLRQRFPNGDAPPRRRELRKVPVGFVQKKISLPAPGGVFHGENLPKEFAFHKRGMMSVPSH
jgi:hypothetical protein